MFHSNHIASVAEKRLDKMLFQQQTERTLVTGTEKAIQELNIFCWQGIRH